MIRTGSLLGVNGYKMLHTHLENESPEPEVLHESMRKLFLQYVVVGGMPEAVQTFLDTHDICQVADVHHAIIEEYKSNMVKYAKADELQWMVVMGRDFWRNCR